jgi:hypothetical protein
MGTPHLIRLSVGLNRKCMPTFIPGAKTIQGKLDAAQASFPALPVSPAALAQQITDLEDVDLQTKTNRGLIPLRTSKVVVVWNSLHQDCTYSETVCQENPEQGLALASASGFHVVRVGLHVREVIEVESDPGTGVAHLLANRQMLPPPSGRPSMTLTFLWRHSVDGLETIVEDASTPTGRTTISGLPLGVVVNFGVAVKDSTGVGPWSQWIAVFIH